MIATGFTGTVIYELKDKGNAWSKIAYMLARYAVCANVGGNTIAAFGQTKLWVDERK